MKTILRATALATVIAIFGFRPVHAGDRVIIGATCWPQIARLDSDGNGVVEAEEVRKNRQQVFEALDRDSDNRLTRHEYDACVASPVPETTKGPFAAIDADGDARISREEFLAASDEDVDGIVVRR